MSIHEKVALWAEQLKALPTNEEWAVIVYATRESWLKNIYALADQIDAVVPDFTVSAYIIEVDDAQSERVVVDVVPDHLDFDTLAWRDDTGFWEHSEDARFD